MSTTAADVGLVVLGLTVPPAIMSCFLPSPSTAYDKASGEISSGPASMGLLKRGEVLGGAVSLGIGIAASLLASQTMGSQAAWIFFGVCVVLGLFFFEYERAMRLGRTEADQAGRQ